MVFLFSIDYLDMEEWMNNNWRYLEELIWRYFLENKDTNLMKSNCNLYVQLTQCQQFNKQFLLWSKCQVTLMQLESWRRPIWILHTPSLLYLYQVSSFIWKILPSNLTVEAFLYSSDLTYYHLYSLHVLYQAT